MKRIDHLLGVSIEQKEIVKAAQAWQALNRWPEVVGEDLARRSWPDRFEHGTVYVAVTGSAWSQELRMIKPVILSRLGSLLGNRALVQDVRFGVRNLPERATAPSKARSSTRNDPGDGETPQEGFQELKDRILSRAKDEE
jgi:predicted nucleic acid-binding Zn ribbon protein